MQNSKFTKYIFVGIFALVGIILIAVYFITGGLNSDYTERVTGTVVSCYQTGWAMDEYTSDEYELSVEYKIGDLYYVYPGIETSVSHEPGTSIELAYIPGEPSVVILASAVDNAFIMPLMGGIMVVIGIVITVLMMRRDKAGATPKQQSSPQNSNNIDPKLY